MRVDIECGSALSYGQTVCDTYDLSKRTDKNVDVCVAMDTTGFWALMLDALREANVHSPL